MDRNATARKRETVNVALALAVATGLVVLRYLTGYLLFHTLVEVFAVSVVLAMFLIVWSSRDRIQNGYLLFIGIAYLYAGSVDLVHALAYKGMGVIPGVDGPDTATQLWLLARYLQAGAILVAPAFARRRPDTRIAHAAFALLAMLGLAATVWWKVFPAAFVEGTGLTPFKIASEWVVIAMLFGGLAGLRSVREAFAPGVLRLIGWSIVVTIASEFAFMLYVDVYGVFNLVGHLLRVAAFFLLYKALVDTTLREPLTVLFREAHTAEKAARALFEQQREVADVLQRGMLSMPDSLLGVELAHAYRSSSELASIGGDFYDAFRTADGRVCFFLGDVSGKGVGAARLSQLSRNTLHAFATEHAEPSKVLSRANEALVPQFGEGRFVTAVLGLLDPSSGELQVATAGHPPPLICGPAACREHPLTADPPLGLFDGLAFSVSRADLAPGDMVLVNSDGLVDTRREGTPFGEARVREVIDRTASRGPAAVVEALMDAVAEFGGGRVTDDVAVFAIRWPGPAPGGPSTEDGART